jgi:hypothetical protein
MTKDEFFDIGRVAYITGNVHEALAAKQALELVVENANSLQQLKAEIAAVLAELDDAAVDALINKNSVPWDSCINKLRQLSAV